MRERIKTFMGGLFHYFFAKNYENSLLFRILNTIDQDLEYSSAFKYYSFCYDR